MQDARNLGALYASQPFELEKCHEDASKSRCRTRAVIGANTRFVNVNHGEIVKFVANGQEFAWDFDGLPQAFDLKQVAPQGAIDHSVRVYVATTLNDGGLGD